MRSSHSSNVAVFSYKVDRVSVQLPDRVKDPTIVCIKSVLFESRISGNVNLPDATMRNVVEIIVRIKGMILRRNVDVVNV